MPKKRRNQSRTLPTRQCKKPKILSNSRRNRDGINYDETGYDLLDYLDESELIEVNDSSVEISSADSTSHENIPLSMQSKRFRPKDDDFVVNKSVYLSKRTGFTDSSISSINLRRKSSRKNSKDVATENMFVIEKIVDMKKIEGNRQFLLKWEGFPETENSWEPEENIDSKEIIKEYLDDLQRIKKEQAISKSIAIVDIEKMAETSIVNEVKSVENIRESKSDSITKCDTVDIEDKNCVIDSIEKTESSPTKPILNKNLTKRKSRKRCKRTPINKQKTLLVKKIKIDLRSDSKNIPEEVIDELESNEILCENTMRSTTEEALLIIEGQLDALVTKVGEDLKADTDVEREEQTENSEKNEEHEINNAVDEKMNSSDGVESSRSNKENEAGDNNGENDDDENDNEDDEAEGNAESDSESDSDERDSDYVAKSDVSDEEFNTETRKKSKTSKNNLNTYFPENLPQSVQEIFQVEKILRMRWNGGIRYFFLKWEGFPDTENSWEPEGNLECPELIEEFLESLKQPKQKPKPVQKVRREIRTQPARAPLVLETLPAEVKIKEPVIKPKGFPKDREPEMILGSGIVNDELNFLIKWKNIDMANLVPAKRANVECPQVVIRFYEKNLMWQNIDGSITTDAAEKITIEEETEEQKRARIEARKMQSKSLQTPVNGVVQRKVGRPPTKLKAASLIQSRKLTTGASRMLNLINNFQSNKFQAPGTSNTNIPISGPRQEPISVPGEPLPQGSITERLLMTDHKDTSRSVASVIDGSSSVASHPSSAGQREASTTHVYARYDNTPKSGLPTSQYTSADPPRTPVGQYSSGDQLKTIIAQCFQIGQSESSVDQSKAISVDQCNTLIGHNIITQQQNSLINKCASAEQINVVKDPYVMPDDKCDNKVNLLSILNQQNITSKATPRQRKSYKIGKTPKNYESIAIDLTDDADYPMSVSDGITRQYESRDIPKEPSPPPDSHFDFPKPNLHLVPPMSSSTMQQSQLFFVSQSSKDTKCLVPSPVQSAPNIVTTNNLSKPVYPAQSYQTFSGPVALSPSPNQGQRINPSPVLADQRSFQQLMQQNVQSNVHLQQQQQQQSFVGSSHNSARGNIKQQLQQSIANNLRTIAPGNTGQSSNGMRYAAMKQSNSQAVVGQQTPSNGMLPHSFQLPTSYMSPGHQSQPQTAQYSPIQYQNALTNEQLMSHQLSQHSAQNQGIIYQNNQYSPIQYQYIINGANQATSFVMPTNQNQVFYPPQGNSSSLRSIMPRKPDYPTQNNPNPTMSNQQSQLQTEQNNQLLMNSYLNLGAYL